MTETLSSRQSIALIESSPLSPASWMALADKVRGENNPLSAQSLEVIIDGLEKLEQVTEAGQTGPALSGLSQSMFVRLARAFNSPTLLKEVGLIYLRDLGLPGVALRHFERALMLGGPEKELRPLTEAAAVAVQRRLALKNGEAPQLSGISAVSPTNLVATAIIRRTGKTLLPPRFSPTAPLPLPSDEETEEELGQPIPEGTAECLVQAAIAVGRGGLRRAEALLRKANERPAESRAMWQGWTDLGQAAYERGKYPEAETAFSEALKFEPNELASQFNAALGFHMNQKFEEAAAAYARADALQPGHPKIWCNLGVLSFQAEAYDQSEEALRCAVEADPGYARAWDNLAAALGAQDKLAEAKEACRRALELRPDYPEAHFKLGIISFSESEWEKAVEEFSRAGVLPAIGAYCEVFLAMIYARLQQTEAAQAAVRRAAQIDPKCDLLWLAWNDLGLAWFTAKDYARASTAYREATRLNPGAAVAWFNLGVNGHHARDLHEAREAYRRAAELDPNLAEAWHNLGTVCVEAGDLTAAIAAFRRETEVAPGNIRAWYDLGVACEKSGQKEAARDAFARAEKLGPPGNET
jgi:superkiller protein 3